MSSPTSFKNPMVTIKTFAQLLGERYQDENFRSRFQDVVGSDIERMDDLLEMMLEFADFARPRLSKVVLADKLRAVLTEIHGECAKRQIRFEWKENGGAPRNRNRRVAAGVYSEERAVGGRFGGQTGQRDRDRCFERTAAVVISYLREGARVASISHYLSEARLA